MARRGNAPRPGKRQKGGRWRIYWRWGGRVHEAVILESECTERRAEAIRAQAAAALDGRADWPLEIARSPAVVAYLAAIAPPPDPEAPRLPMDKESILAEYDAELRGGKIGDGWRQQCLARLSEFLDAVGEVKAITPRAIGDFLNEIALKRSPATRNRVHAVLSRFSRWLRTQGYMPDDFRPMAEIKMVREPRPAGGIVVLEGDHVERVLAAAEPLKDGIAVWIALLAGLRRGEIVRLAWSDVGENTLTVRTSKTGDGRDVPLSARLAERLKKETRRAGRIVPWPEKFNGWNSAALRLIDVHLPEKLAEAWAAQEREMIESGVEPEAIEERKKQASVAAGLLGWNCFRHTFATRLVRGGVPLDTVSAWMGNTPEVCRRHYARFVPASHRDGRIDMVDQTGAAAT